MFAPEANVIDTTSDFVEMQLASMIGSTAGVERCDFVYRRCEKDAETLLGEVVKASKADA